jgi:hypothetical protein
MKPSEVSRDVPEKAPVDSTAAHSEGVKRRHAKGGVGGVGGADILSARARGHGQTRMIRHGPGTATGQLKNKKLVFNNFAPRRFFHQSFSLYHKITPGWAGLALLAGSLEIRDTLVRDAYPSRLLNTTQHLVVISRPPSLADGSAPL